MADKKTLDDTRAEYARLKAERARLERTPADDGAAAAALAAPAIRKGESALTSRPLRLLNLFAAIASPANRALAKPELEACERLQRAMDDTGTGITGSSGGMPFVLGSSLLPDRLVYTDEFRVVKAMMAPTAPADPDEVAWVADRTGSPRLRKAAQSYLDDTAGGTLVAPPDQGELIELVRSQEVLQRAGARVFPLPPQGKVVFPRQTSPSTGYWITESTAIPESQVGTGQVSMQAKKLAVLFRVPNELFKYASGAADALLRQDAAKTLALGFDYAALYGDGSGGQPKGLANYAEVITHTASVTAAAGDTLQPQDGFKMAGKVEDRNFEFEGWVMRPLLWAKVASTRADAVTTSDAAGPFVQSLTRELGAGVGSTWCGYRVNKSTVVRNDIVKGGSGATLTQVWGGQWSDLLLGMYGAIEFASNNMGEATFIADQTLIRGILHCDSVPRHPGAFVVCTSLVAS